MGSDLLIPFGVALLAVTWIERALWTRLDPALVRFVARLSFDIGEPLPPSVSDHLEGFEGQTDRLCWRRVGDEVLFRGGGAVGMRFTGRIRFEGTLAVVTWAPYPLFSILGAMLAMASLVGLGTGPIAFAVLVSGIAVVLAASRRSAGMAFREKVWLPIEGRLLEHVRQIEEG